MVGLRNPGSDYERTRHNVGFEVLECVLDRLGERLGRGPLRVHGQVAQSGYGDTKVMYLAPNRFMNESGDSVRAAALYYKVVAEDLLVIHDDIDLPFGRLRIQVGGGSGGHNGIRSVEKSLGTKDFSRLKVGVGRPPGSVDPATYVLKTFSRKERPAVDLMVEMGADVVELWLTDRPRAQEKAALFEAHPPDH
ncbi:MAG: aminoacyl-tRNA hydrolase [Acidimicrobiia bacterium]